MQLCMFCLQREWKQILPGISSGKDKNTDIIKEEEKSALKQPFLIIEPVVRPVFIFRLFQLPPDNVPGGIRASLTASFALRIPIASSPCS